MIIRKLFSRKKSDPRYQPLKDFSLIGTDIHSHLIPGIDDGVQNMDEAIAMIRSMRDLGFKKLVTTPHIMSDYFRNNRETIEGGLETLKQALNNAGITVEIHAAAEYYFDESLPSLIASKNILTITGNYLLFEVSYINKPENLMEVVFSMQVNGYVPLLAHPERYPYWNIAFHEYAALKEAGVLFQLNINSLTGYYGLGPKRTAEKLIDEKMIDFTGSDLHGPRHLEQLKKSLSEKYLWKLADQGVLNSKLYS